MFPQRKIDLTLDAQNNIKFSDFDCIPDSSQCFFGGCYIRHFSDPDRKQYKFWLLDTLGEQHRAFFQHLTTRTIRLPILLLITSIVDFPMRREVIRLFLSIARISEACGYQYSAIQLPHASSCISQCAFGQLPVTFASGSYFLCSAILLPQ